MNFPMMFIFPVAHRHSWIWQRSRFYFSIKCPCDIKPRLILSSKAFREGSSRSNGRCWEEARQQGTRAGSTPLPLPQQRQGADMHKVIFLIYTRQTQHHATQSAAGSGWGAGYGLLLQLLLGAMCAGQWGEPRECPGVSSSHKAPQGHLLAEGNHNSQDASTGTHFSLGARSTAFQIQFKYLKYRGRRHLSICFAGGGLLWCLIMLRFLPKVPSLPALAQTCTFHGTCCPAWPRAASPQTLFPF